MSKANQDLDHFLLVINQTSQKKSTATRSGKKVQRLVAEEKNMQESLD